MSKKKTKRKRGFDPFDHTMKQAGISAGLIGGTYIVGQVPRAPGAVGDRIHGGAMGGMGMLSVVQPIHATGGVFGALGDLDKKVKRKKR